MITVGDLAPGGEAHLERYATGVIPLLHAAGVKIIGRYRGIEPLVGNEALDLVSIMEFASVEAMKEFLTSEAYLAEVPHRQRAFRDLKTFACETL